MVYFIGDKKCQKGGKCIYLARYKVTKNNSCKYFCYNHCDENYDKKIKLRKFVNDKIYDFGEINIKDAKDIMSYCYILNKLICKLDKVFKEIKIGNSIIKFSSNRHKYNSRIFTLTVDHSNYTQKIRANNDGTNKGYIIKIKNIYDNCKNISYKKRINMVNCKDAFYFINKMMREMYCGYEIDYITGKCSIIETEFYKYCGVYYKKYKSVLDDIKQSNINVILSSYLLGLDF
uniref:Uncharacterized protein n=1 Tax=Pithovirus LCDPAC02 TaxID=2506601 RepID=A0A481YPU6_9VIRU|nr:MAG: hypothetical protein LCDPAC02_00240 [Pithovirus LCDPAC02]